MHLLSKCKCKSKQSLQNKREAAKTSKHISGLCCCCEVRQNDAGCCRMMALAPERSPEKASYAAGALAGGLSTFPYDITRHTSVINSLLHSAWLASLVCSVLLYMKGKIVQASSRDHYWLCTSCFASCASQVFGSLLSCSFCWKNLHQICISRLTCQVLCLSIASAESARLKNAMSAMARNAAFADKEGAAKPLCSHLHESDVHLGGVAQVFSKINIR